METQYKSKRLGVAEDAKNVLYSLAPILEPQEFKRMARHVEVQRASLDKEVGFIANSYE